MSMQDATMESDKATLLQEATEEARGMKISELKMKLMAMGVLTAGFCEKDEFIKAYAEAKAQKSIAMDEDSSDDDDEDDDEYDNELNAALAAAAIGGNPVSDLPSSVLRRVDKLKELHGEREKVMEEYLKERAQLEAKYNALCKPLFDKRSQIIKGELDDEIAKEQNADDIDVAVDANDDDDDDEKATGIPHFWLGALSNMGPVAEMITEDDIDCLECLQDVVCDDDADGTGFTLKFAFSQNDYFENTVLTKRYEVPNLLLADEPILKNVEGCEIQWKEGKCLTHKITSKQQRGKGKNAGQIRTVQRKERSESFFHFFEPPKMPSLEDMDETEADRLEHAFDADYDQAQAFRSHIIPKAVVWFTGEAMEQEMQQALKDMQGMSWPGGVGAAAGVNASGGENPECKQQ